MYSLPDLSYDYNALEPYIDATTMQLHHGKHHAAYVKNVNDALVGQNELLSLPIEELISALDKIPESVRTKVRNNGGGHANHSLFWTVMAPRGEREPSGKLLAAIQNTFGDVSTLKKKLSDAGVGRFGSGWAWLFVKGDPSAGSINSLQASSGQGKLEIIDMPNQNSPIMEAVPAGRQGNIPILGLDVWEHAYYLKYQNRRAEYIEAWWNVVDWNEVARRFDQAKKGLKV